MEGNPQTTARPVSLPVNVAALADAKRLPVQFLAELGLSDLPRSRGVGIGYFDVSGDDVAVKHRTALKATDGSYWPKGKPLAAYGQNRLDRAAKAGFLILVEGESDCWALWYHGLPALGLPGASTARATLFREHVEAIDTVYVHREPDGGGTAFVKAVTERLTALGFKGKVFELRMPSGIKDPADLHVADPESFKDRLQEAILASSAMELPRSPERNGHVGNNGAAAPDPLGYHLTDVGNARRVVARHGKDLRFCHAWKEWFIWDGRRWAADETAEAVRRVKETQAALYRWAAEKLAELSKQGEGGDEDDERSKQIKKLTKLLNHCLDWEDARDIARCLQLATSEPAMPVVPAQLDADPFLLNCLNGTLDLRTGGLREHRHEDYLTKICPVEYRPDATCPLWDAFMRRILDENTDLIDYLRRVVGYSLTGDVREQSLWFLYGTGANGKSTFLTTVLAVVGDYGMQAVSDLLLAKKNESHPTERADLFGRRFVATIEVDNGRHMAEALMKQLTGGDKVRARRMRQDFFEFMPTWKIFLAANHKPMIRGTDHAAWRRIKLVPFTVTIPPEEQDKTLPQKLLAELPGILAWAVRGCLEWQRFGLGEPEEVRVATDAYRAEQDGLATFIATCCFTSSHARVRTSAMHESYERWSGDKVSAKTFTAMMEEKGYPSKRGGHGGYAFYHGIGLPTPEDGGSGDGW
jgi:putative DNA primase/helicase